MNGQSELSRKLKRLARGGPAIARSAVSAGLATMARAARKASPGAVKKEIGFYIRRKGDAVTGRAGLMQYPHRNKGKGPHGLFLDIGTKYIVARHMITNALRESRPLAMKAAEKAARNKLNKILKA